MNIRSKELTETEQRVLEITEVSKLEFFNIKLETGMLPVENTNDDTFKKLLDIPEYWDWWHYKVFFCLNDFLYLVKGMGTGGVAMLGNSPKDALVHMLHVEAQGPLPTEIKQLL